MFFSCLFSISSLSLSDIKVYNTLAVRAIDFLLRSLIIRLVVVSACSTILVLGVTSHLVSSSALLLLHKTALVLRRILLLTVC